MLDQVKKGCSQMIVPSDGICNSCVRVTLDRIRHLNAYDVEIIGTTPDGAEVIVKTDADRLDSLLKCRRSFLKVTGKLLRVDAVENATSARAANSAWLDAVEQALERGRAK